MLSEGLSHKVEGICNCFLSQGIIISSRKPSITDSHGKGAHDLDLVLSREPVKEKVVSESDLLAPSCVPVPRPSFVLVCFLTNCCFTGRQRSREVSHKVISLGRGTISKCCGS